MLPLLQIFEPSHLKYAFKRDPSAVFKDIHDLISLRLQACAHALIHHQAPVRTDWEAQRQALAVEAEAVCLV